MRASAISGLEFETTDTQSFLNVSSSRCSSSPVELKGRNPLSEVTGRTPALLAQQLRRPSTGHLALPVEFEDDQLPSGLLRGSLELLEELDEVSIDFDGRCSHANL